MSQSKLSLKWMMRFVRLTNEIAKWSKDPNTKIGAVIITEDDKDIVSVGYNGIARGVDDRPIERSSRENDEKYYWYAHAERNAIYNAARKGRNLTGTSIILNKGVPCTGCAIGVIQSGIKRVYCSNDPMERKKWAEEGMRSQTMFREAGVALHFYDAEAME